MKLKLLYKILGVITLIAGLTLIIFGFIDYFSILIYNDKVGVDAIKALPVIKFYIASPFLFAGFFFIILGWGKSPKERAMNK